MSGVIHKLTMPKWGLTMEKGTVAAWNREVGDFISEGEEVCDVETEKIAGGMESPVSGILRRQVASVGDVLPIGGLLGIIADESVSEEEIDSAIAAFEAAPPESGEDGDSAEAAHPEQVEIAGRRVRHLVQRGEGVPVVLVHGFGGNLDNWIMNHAALAAGGRTVAALDLPGHGESLKDVASGSLEELADAVLAYLDFMDFEEAHLVGHSLGAAISVAAQRQAPGRVKSLTLIAPAGLGQAADRGYIDGFIEAEGRRDLKPVLQKLFADTELVTRQLVNDTLKFKRLEGMKDALAKIAAAGLAAADAAKGLRDLAGSLPILVLWGSDDAVISAPSSLELPGVEFHLLPGKGHMVMVEAADEVNRLIGAFLG